jgi:uncharacterized protein with HEPN domain
MSKRDPQLLLEDIQMAIDKIERYAADMRQDDFLADIKTVDAVVRNLEIIGEAVRQMPETYKTSHPQIPWTQVAGLRNRIVHDYAGLDLELIWQIIIKNLPDLKKLLGDLKA